MDYRASATNTNGGVLLRFPRAGDDGRRRPQRLPGRRARQRHRRRPLGRDRSRSARRSSYAPSNVAAAQADARVEHAARSAPIRSHITGAPQRRARQRVPRRARLGAGHIGLENAGTGVMYRHVRVTRVRRPTEGTVGGTVPGDALADARRAGDLRRLHARASRGVHGVDDRDGDLDRRVTRRCRVSDPGHLTNGAFALPQPLQVSSAKSAWTGPTSNEAVDVGVQAAHRGHRPAADRRLHEDADLHAVDDGALAGDELQLRAARLVARRDAREDLEHRLRGRRAVRVEPRSRRRPRGPASRGRASARRCRRGSLVRPSSAISETPTPAATKPCIAV